MAEKNRKPGRGGRPGTRWSPGWLARRHPVISAAAVIGAGLIIFVLAWFQPQKLFLNKTVNESVPGVIQTAPAGETSRSATVGRSPLPGLSALRSGSFRSLEHPTTGTAIVLRRPAGRLILRLERLSTSNGPDLRVYLSHVPASADLRAYRTGFHRPGRAQGQPREPELCHPGRHRPLGIQKRGHMVSQIRSRIRRSPAVALPSQRPNRSPIDEVHAFDEETR